ncbi:hypothetical protein NKH18_46985 [Streptomyces sp. M10(2022)]
MTIERLEEAAARVAALREWAVPVTTGVRRPGIGLVAARRALVAVGTHPVGQAGPVHTVRLMSEANMAVGVAPGVWTAPSPASAGSPPPSTWIPAPTRWTSHCPLPDPSSSSYAMLCATLAARRPRSSAHPPARPRHCRHGSPTGSRPARLPLLLTRGAGLANALAAAEHLTGRTWTGPLSGE